MEKLQPVLLYAVWKAGCGYSLSCLPGGLKPNTTLKQTEPTFSLVSPALL